MEWKDIDFQNRVIHVTGTLVQNKAGFYKDLPKTRLSARVIPMLDNVYELLKTRKKEQLEQKLRMGELWEPLSGMENLVATTNYGKPLGKGYLNNAIHTIVKEIQKQKPDFPYIPLHGFRHTFATRCIENGVDPQVLKAILGHSKLSITMDLYAHVLMDEKVKEIQKIAELFPSKKIC